MHDLSYINMQERSASPQPALQEDESESEEAVNRAKQEAERRQEEHKHEQEEARKRRDRDRGPTARIVSYSDSESDDEHIGPFNTTRTTTDSGEGDKGCAMSPAAYSLCRGSSYMASLCTCMISQRLSLGIEVDLHYLHTGRRRCRRT